MHTIPAHLPRRRTPGYQEDCGKYPRRRAHGGMVCKPDFIKLGAPAVKGKNAVAAQNLRIRNVCTWMLGTLMEPPTSVCHRDHSNPMFTCLFSAYSTRLKAYGSTCNRSGSRRCPRGTDYAPAAKVHLSYGSRVKVGTRERKTMVLPGVCGPLLCDGSAGIVWPGRRDAPRAGFRRGRIVSAPGHRGPGRTG